MPTELKEPPAEAFDAKDFVEQIFVDVVADCNEGGVCEAGYIDKKAAELAALIAAQCRAGDGWQDVMTAPRGEKVLLLRQDGEKLVDDWGKYAVYNNPRFTHWQPLPRIPSNTKAKE